MLIWITKSDTSFLDCQLDKYSVYIILDKYSVYIISQHMFLSDSHKTEGGGGGGCGYI